MLDEIIHGCCKQHRESQKELYRMFYGYGMSITLRYADSRDEAAETLNDAFMKVFDNIKTFDTNRSFKPWFRRIVINTAINKFHKNKKRRELTDAISDKEPLRNEEKIISGISYDELIEMVQKLSPAYRTVFNLFVIEGFTHKEIAQKLEISEGTSKSNLHKAKSNLRDLLEQNLTQPDRHD
ncbi:RNA polymerase sigma factor [Gracilimonas sp.]|uniref:RNA polymerase sigma factor n=1 Tax=Gracilimonas sp. TaxID=1974203 RepID=UPI002871F638|nr:RNA polymerase sigma factor [Gracilimonas sp.]